MEPLAAVAAVPAAAERQAGGDVPDGAGWLLIINPPPKYLSFLMHRCIGKKGKVFGARLNNLCITATGLHFSHETHEIDTKMRSLFNNITQPQMNADTRRLKAKLLLSAFIRENLRSSAAKTPLFVLFVPLSCQFRAFRGLYS
ncbi:MAG: hypothetical protein PHP45_02005 [Elusimicrobiales bacterium]|nr:hypothetical protein [Elusimicrobiales bacterium]